jgi:hypothetical protein
MNLNAPRGLANSNRSRGAQLVSYVRNYSIDYFYLGLQLRLRIIGLGAASPHLLSTTTSFRGQWACPRPDAVTDARKYKVALRSQIHLWGNKILLRNKKNETIVNVAYSMSWWLINGFFPLTSSRITGAIEPWVES